MTEQRFASRANLTDPWEGCHHVCSGFRCTYIFDVRIPITLSETFVILDTPPAPVFARGKKARGENTGRWKLLIENERGRRRRRDRRGTQSKANRRRGKKPEIKYYRNPFRRGQSSAVRCGCMQMECHQRIRDFQKTKTDTEATLTE